MCEWDKIPVGAKVKVRFINTRCPCGEPFTDTGPFLYQGHERGMSGLMHVFVPTVKIVCDGCGTPITLVKTHCGLTEAEGEPGRRRKSRVEAWLERNGWGSLTKAVNELAEVE